AGQSIDVGLHPTTVYAKNGAVFVTDTASNDVSVIDTSSDSVVQTIATQPWPQASVGYEPDGVTLTDDGHLLVTLGRANAVAVYRFQRAQEPVSYVGLLPTDYFPTAITTVGKDVVVSNTRGVDARGNGDPSVTQFGENVTPNQHALAKQFGLYDNTYDIGTNSAEGHNWLMQADNPEYTESSAGEYLRSYDTEDDALGHQSSGFLWTGAQVAGKSVRDFGEFQQFLTKPPGATW